MELKILSKFFYYSLVIVASPEFVKQSSVPLGGRKAKMTNEKGIQIIGSDGEKKVKLVILLVQCEDLLVKAVSGSQEPLFTDQ